jgi:hypothetical protein
MQREIQRSLAELHQLAARCHLARICRELLPEAQELAQRGRPADAPVQIELIHNVSRRIRSLEELNRELAAFIRT